MTFSAEDRGRLETAFSVFASLWALSTLFQLVALDSMVRGIRLGTVGGYVELALALSAFIVIWKPSLGTLAILAVIQVTDAFIMLPRIPNHRLVTCFVNLTFLAVLVSVRLKAEHAELRKAVVFNAFSTAARVETLLVYFYAALAKLNTGFLDPATSCGSTFYSRMASNLPIFPNAPWAAESAIHATLLCEAGIPLLLLFAPTRMIGVCTGLLFHFVLSLDYVQHTMDFSSIMFALLFLFVPLSATRKASEVLRINPSSDAEVRWARLVVLASWSIVLLSGLLVTGKGNQIAFISRHIVWYTFGACVIALFLVAACNHSTYTIAERAKAFRLSGPLPWGCVLLLAINGLGPYLGFKTRSAFDMYSNLRMEPPRPNHLVVPRSLDLWGYQSDRVQVLESNDLRMQAAKARGVELLYFEFARHVQRSPDLRGRFLRNGHEFSISNEHERGAIEPPGAIASKLLWFRDVDLQDPARCDW